MIGLLQIGATMGQITYNQLKREQPMNKQHTFCFKVEDVSKSTLFDFLYKASQNHLFEDIPETAHEFCIGPDTDAFNKPQFFTENTPSFESPSNFQLIGIDKRGVVEMNSKIEKFGENTVFVEYPCSTSLEIHLRKAASNKQEQKTTEVPKDDEHRNQLKQEQTMNKQHTFCFKITDVLIGTLHRFLIEASKNHLFADLPDILQDCRNGSLEYDEPALYVNGNVEFTDSTYFTRIGISEYGHVVTYRKPEFFGKDTVIVEAPTEKILNQHLIKATLNKQEQAPKDDEIVQLFQTKDGRSFKTLAEAEYHRDRACLIEKLTDDTGCQYEDAERALNWLEANHPKLKED